MDKILDRSLTFYRKAESSLTIWGMRVESTPHEVRLIVRVTPENYRQIEDKAWFNFKPELRNPLESGKLKPEVDITLDLVLQPNLLSQFGDPETAFSPPPSDGERPPWLEEENWFVLIVTQQQGDTTVSYRTFWDYLHLDRISDMATAGTEVLRGIGEFFQTSLSPSPRKTDSPLERLFATFLDEMAELEEESDEPQNLTAVVQAFFNDDDWEYITSESGTVLQMAFQGQSDRWGCYAKVREPEQQFLFYSIFPSPTPPERRQVAAEFITKANYGLAIGNFELDFRDGEIRYKTSIDVEGDRLTPALVKPVVYINVLTMDRYFSSLQAVLDGELSPDDAIARVEAS